MALIVLVQFMPCGEEHPAHCTVVREAVGKMYTLQVASYVHLPGHTLPAAESAEVQGLSVRGHLCTDVTV